MKNIILVFLSLFPVALFAQSLERQVICSSGGYSDATSVKASSTIGEAAISTYLPGTLIVTQGFQQPDGLADVAVIELESGVSINAYPNPTSTAVILDFEVKRPLQVHIRMLDVLGRVLDIQQNTLYIDSETQYSLDVSTLPAGNYFIHLSDDSGRLNNSIKIQKID